MKKLPRVSGRRTARSLMTNPNTVFSGGGGAVAAPSSPSSKPNGGAARIRRLLVPFLLLAALTLPCAVLYLAAAPMAPLVPSAWSVRWDLAPPLVLPDENPAADAVDLDSEDARLEKVLKEAAMEDKTVILTTMNAAWASPGSVIDLFIESFRIGNGTCVLLNHLVIISLDLKAYDRCMSIHFHCFALIAEEVDFSGEKKFMSAGYLEMMWRRIDFLRVVLEKGYNFIFSDADIMWFRNPLPNFYHDGDFQIACDHFMGDSTDLSNKANGGFNYVKSNNRSIEFYNFWYSSREKYPGYHDQDVLNFIKHDPFIAEIGIRFRFLSTTYFGGICEPSRDFSKVCTMHANCCIGLSSKLHDIRVILEDWRNYMSLPPSIKNSGVYLWRVPQNCSLSALNQ
ncbi:uncharacterized protein At4g15970 [Typha latifolia]|uniref:uncharacterized protein At4g15970 n=1 Tax=Typha latifolia TaxID=4733 RepID=UPI003C2F78BA